MEFINVRDSKGLKPEIESLVALLSERKGSPATITEIVMQALEYGLPFVRQDICSEIDIPRNTLPKSQQLAIIAKQIFELGLRQAVPGESQ